MSIIKKTTRLRESFPRQTTEFKTTTKFTARFCYATNQVVGSLRRTRRCTASREKRAIEINGIRGFIGEISDQPLTLKSRR